ncbi:phosphohistidine phosphatase SixA [Alteromonas flava]|uniref:phosphohistidine phosphatase SixA n=1 Tax=Alteromonas flava TaxID=2048003 RepID=UPI000C28C946|nr:phosphohistidine phosphatase SixA [Alteromonas flava]
MSAHTDAKTRVIIVRHGEAEAALIDDKSRQLTDRGRNQTQLASVEMAKFLPNQKVDVALVSPYRRAQQTFDVLSIRIAVKQRVECADITPMSSPFTARNIVLGYTETATAEQQTLLLVSHMPLVSFLTAELAQLETPPIFSTSAFAVIDIDNATARGRLLELEQLHN